MYYSLAVSGTFVLRSFWYVSEWWRGMFFFWKY